MDTELKDWLFQQFKDCEDGKLTEKQKELFLETMETGKHIPEIQEIFNKYMEWKDKEDEKLELDNETKYLVAKQWIGDIIFQSRMAGNPMFKDKEYKVILNKVLNDFYKLEYKEPTSS